MTPIADVMTPNPIRVQPHTPLGTCAQLIQKHGIRHLPVVDNEGRVLGVVSDMTLFSVGNLVGAEGELWVFFDADDTRSTARDVASEVKVTVDGDASAAEAFRKLVETRQDYLLVVDDGVLQGIVTEHDGVHWAVELVPPELTTDHLDDGPVWVVDALRQASVAMDLMREQGVRHVVVTEQGKLHGVVSYRDLVELQIPQGRKLTAGDAVHGYEVYSVVREAPLSSVAKKMAETKVGCLPIVDEQGAPIGIVTRSDLIAQLILAMEEEAAFSDDD